MNKYYWSGISHANRLKAIGEITDIVDKSATILNFKQFSDISLSLILEMEENRVNDLKIRLKEILLIEGSEPESQSSTHNCMVLFNITFSKGTGDLKMEVPEVPG
jgi:hypothetical protein